MTLPPELEQQAREIANAIDQLFRQRHTMREVEHDVRRAMLVAIAYGRRQGLEEAAKVIEMAAATSSSKHTASVCVRSAEAIREAASK